MNNSARYLNTSAGGRKLKERGQGTEWCGCKYKIPPSSPFGRAVRTIIVVHTLVQNNHHDDEIAL